MFFFIGPRTATPTQPKVWPHTLGPPAANASVVAIHALVLYAFHAPAFEIRHVANAVVARNLQATLNHPRRQTLHLKNPKNYVDAVGVQEVHHPSLKWLILRLPWPKVAQPRPRSRESVHCVSASSCAVAEQTRWSRRALHLQQQAMPIRLAGNAVSAYRVVVRSRRMWRGRIVERAY